MTILFAANELDSFVALPGNTLPAMTTASAGTYYDNNFSRAGILFNGSSASDMRTCNVYGDIAEIWLHFEMYFQDNNWTNGQVPVEIRNSAGTGVLRLANVSTSQWQFQYWSGSAWTAIGGSQSRPSGRHVFDIRCKIDSTTGDFAAYMDGVLITGWQQTGDTDWFSGSAVDQVIFRRITTSTVIDFVGSEFIISTTTTLGQRVATLVPNGAGASTAWTGTFADVDDITPNDADFVSANAGSLDELFTLSDLSVTAQSYDPVAVTIGTRARIGVTGPSNLQTLLRTASTDYASSNKNPITSFEAVTQTIYEDNPNTTAEWTISEIQGLEIGVRSIT